MGFEIDIYTAGFIVEELHDTLCHIKNGKVLGLDGLYMELYKAMWETIGDDYMRMSNKDFCVAFFLKSLNQAIIKLILKGVNKEMIRGWRLIL